MNGRSAAIVTLVCCLVVATALFGSVGAAQPQSSALASESTEPRTPEPTPAHDTAAAAAAVGSSPERAAQNASLTVTDSNVSLVVRAATDGDSYEYDLSNPDAAADLSVELTGVETTEVDTVSANLSPRMRWDPQLRGDVEPTGPSGVGNPQIELTARTYSWQSGYEPDNTTTGLLFGNGHGSAHTIRSVPKNVELHALTIGGLSSRRGGCADVYVNEDGQNGAYGEGIRVASSFCPSDTGPQTIEFDTPYVTSSDNVTVEFVSTIGGPVEVPLAPVSSARDSYQNGRDGDAGNYLANVTVSTGTPANVSLRDSAGDTLSFGALSDGETVTRSMDLALGDVLRVSYAANGADVLGTIRYREASLSRNVSITVNGNRTAHTGTLAPGETVSLPANDSWLRSGTNTITIGLDRAGMDAPARAVDVRYRHELDRSAAVDADAGTRADASDSAGTSDAASTPGAVADTVVTDVSFERGTIRSSETAVVVVTVRNPQSTADTHLVELELFDQVVNSREVTVAANDEATVRFVHTIVASGTYTARVGNETATIRVLASDETPSSTPVADSPSTALPSIRLLVVVALVSFVVAALLARRD